jgi:hypothetical protein
LSRRKAYYSRKIKRAVHLLFYKRHRKPGAAGWELRKKLGADYPKVLDVLDKYLEKLDLQVKTVFEGEEPVEKPTLKQLNSARFYITLRGELDAKEAKMMGWRIDDIAGLAITISRIISRRGRIPRKEVEEVLRGKLPGWRVNANLDRYIRSGYVSEDENGQLYLDWRTRAEIDQKSLIDLLLGAEA